MPLQISSARVAAADGSTVAVRIKDAGEQEVMISRDSPAEEWAALAAWRAKGGEIAPHGPEYLITAARFANAEGTAIVITTEDQGDVLISERDRPELWAKCMAWRDGGGSIALYIAPTFEPRDTPAAQFAALKQLMIAKRLASEAEIEAALAEARAGQIDAPADAAGAAVRGR